MKKLLAAIAISSMALFGAAACENDQRDVETAPKTIESETGMTPETERETEMEIEQREPGMGGQDIEQRTEDYGQEMQQGAQDVGQDVEHGAQDLGQDVEQGAQDLGQDVEQGAEDVREDIR